MKRISKLACIIFFATLLLTGCDRMNMVNFKNMHLPDKKNFYLVCPENYCSVTPNATSSPFSVSAANLQLAWQAMIASQSRTKLVDSDPANNKQQYVQYSRFFHFPDYIDVQFIPIDNHTSTLAVYSRARFGYYDFHVNEKRVKQWLSLLPNYLPK